MSTKVYRTIGHVYLLLLESFAGASYFLDFSPLMLLWPLILLKL